MVDFNRMLNEKRSAAARTLGFDDFLDHAPGKGGGMGGFLKWKEDGKIVVWMHTKQWCTLFPNHPWPKIVEYTDKETEQKVRRVFGDRWGCHEHEKVLSSQNFRDKVTGERDLPPQLCPICKLTEHAFQQVRAGRWKPTQPIFKFEADDPRDALVLTAAGLYGGYNDKALSADANLKKEVRLARINLKDAFKQNMKARIQYLYSVVDDANPGDGVQTTFEGIGLTKKIQKAIRDEMHKAGRRGDPKDADPTLHPYPIEWRYFEDRDFDDKYEVTTLNGEQPSQEILDLIKGEPPEIDHLVGLGDCYLLRAQMEEHLCDGVSLPWEQLFGEAKKRGLMQPPDESKEDAEDDENAEEFFERKAAEQSASNVGGGAAETSGDSWGLDGNDAAPVTKAGPVVIGVDHNIWNTTPARVERFQSFAPVQVKGRDVHIDAPETASPELVQAVIARCKALGAATVDEIVSCEHCGQAMTMSDPACPSCGAEVDEDGALISRPCLNPECKAQVLYNAKAPTEPAICGKCATIHVGVEEGGEIRWQVKPAEAAAPAPAARRRSRGGGSRPGEPPFAR